MASIGSDGLADDENTRVNNAWDALPLSYSPKETEASTTKPSASASGQPTRITNCKGSRRTKSKSSPAKHVKCSIGGCRYHFNPDTDTIGYGAHIRRFHEGKKHCFICPTCGRGFKHRRGLQTHDNWHKGLFPFVCAVEGCGKKFRNERQFRLHKQKHHPSPGEKLPYYCEICGKGDVKKYNFELHMRSHTGERPIHCGTCDRTFKSASNLRYHRDRCLGNSNSS